jgi:transcriptional regulator with XRE-family HTH domain
MAVDQQSWDARLAAAVGRNVRQLRQDRSTPLSAQALSNRTADLGHKVHRSVIAKLENGERASVTLGDLFVLAAALEVPPFALLAPLVTSSRVEVLPGQMLSEWDAVDWLAGDLTVGIETADNQITDAYELRFRFRVAMLQYVDAFHRAETAEGSAREIAIEGLSAQERYIDQLRKALNRLGVQHVPSASGGVAILRESRV